MGGMTALLTSSNDFILIGEKREGKRFIVSPFLPMAQRTNVSFTPLERPAACNRDKGQRSSNGVY
jgi:DUF1365 family protein